VGELSYGFWSAQVNRGDSANGAEVRSIIDKIQVDSVGDGLNVCVYPSEQYKTSRIDIFLTIELETRLATQRALIARLLERGTRALPSLRQFNQFVDDLFGASFDVEIDQVGGNQVIHLSFEVIDDSYLPDNENVLKTAFSFLSDVLMDPAVEGCPQGFPSAIVEQETNFLRKNIDDLFSDKMAYAQRRCIELMCENEPYAIAPYGCRKDLPGQNGLELLSVHKQGLQKNRVDIYVNACASIENIRQLINEFFSWDRSYVPKEVQAAAVQQREPIVHVERGNIRQGKLVCGLRTCISIIDNEYPALLLFNLLLGADGHSRLYQSLREQHGLCYHISSFIEPLCALQFVEAGVDAADYMKACHQIRCQYEEIEKVGPSESELESAQVLALHWLSSLNDDREALVRFHFQRNLAGVNTSQNDLCEKLLAVQPDDIMRVAKRIVPDTTYFLSNS
tara:strand:- start:1343 stop:2695 length:1353 start_codon:yes stop_codon:yes gene_type:complete